MRAIEFVWETRTDLVEEVLKRILGVDVLDCKDPRYFQQHNAAAKLALEEMSVEERAELELELETWRAKGHLEKIQ
jgi:hypothetical protein